MCRICEQSPSRVGKRDHQLQNGVKHWETSLKWYTPSHFCISVVVYTEKRRAKLFHSISLDVPCGWVSWFVSKQVSWEGSCDGSHNLTNDAVSSCEFLLFPTRLGCISLVFVRMRCWRPWRPGRGWKRCWLLRQKWTLCRQGTWRAQCDWERLGRLGMVGGKRFWIWQQKSAETWYRQKMPSVTFECLSTKEWSGMMPLTLSLHNDYKDPTISCHHIQNCQHQPMPMLRTTPKNITSQHWQHWLLVLPLLHSGLWTSHGFCTAPDAWLNLHCRHGFYCTFLAFKVPMIELCEGDRNIKKHYESWDTMKYQSRTCEKQRQIRNFMAFMWCETRRCEWSQVSRIEDAANYSAAETLSYDGYEWKFMKDATAKFKLGSRDGVQHFFTFIHGSFRYDRSSNILVLAKFSLKAKRDCSSAAKLLGTANSLLVIR